MQEGTATASLARRLFTGPGGGSRDILTGVLSKQVEAAKDQVQGLQWELQEARMATQRANAERDAAVVRYRNAVSSATAFSPATKGAILC